MLAQIAAWRWDSVTYPLEYLPCGRRPIPARWDSVTYPLDILDTSMVMPPTVLGFSHLSP